MASTYSSNLRLELMATGEKSGTWGSITNGNLGTLLEEAIGGVANVVHDNTASYTLTTANGAIDEARNAVLVVTGVLTANRELITPAIEKTYIVFNNTSGGFSLSVGPSGGSKVTVDNGSKVLIYVDGTNANYAVNAFGTDLAVADGGTGASTAAGARTNLDVPGLNTNNTFNGDITLGSNQDMYFNGATDAAAVGNGTNGFNAVVIEESQVSVQQSDQSNILCTKASSPASNTYIVFRINGSGFGSISYDGASGTNYNTSSDANLKRNIRPTQENGIAWVKSLQVRDFEWVADGKPDTGLVAQEVQDIFPLAVSEMGDGTLGYDPSKLVPRLIRALQQAIERIEALEGA